MPDSYEICKTKSYAVFNMWENDIGDKFTQLTRYIIYEHDIKGSNIKANKTLIFSKIDILDNINWFQII